MKGGGRKIILSLHPSFLLPHVAIPRHSLAGEGRCVATALAFSSKAVFPTTGHSLGGVADGFDIPMQKVSMLFTSLLGWVWGFSTPVHPRSLVKASKLMEMVADDQARYCHLPKAHRSEWRWQQRPSGEEGEARPELSPGLIPPHANAQQEYWDLRRPNPSAGTTGLDPKPGPSAATLIPQALLCES